MDATGWAVVVAVIAAIPSWIFVGAAWVKAGQADGRAERAEERAEDALDHARELTQSVTRIGDIMAAQKDGRAVPVPVTFQVERVRGSRYALRNVGSEEATSVEVVDLPDGLIVRNLPERVTLGPLQSHEIFLGGSAQVPVPSEIQVACDQLQTPAFVPVPPRF